MKNLKFKILLLFSFLVAAQTLNAQIGAQQVVTQYFTMTISEGYRSPNRPGMMCFDIELKEFNIGENDNITITDGMGKFHECNEDPCEFTWHYPIFTNPYERLITCSTHRAGSIYFSDGCTIIIDPFAK